MIQESINKSFFSLLVFTLIFGVVFYDILGFDYTDEICATLIFILFGYKTFHTKNWDISVFFLLTLSVFAFYLVYSLKINTNTRSATITDFIIQIKPYLGFFSALVIIPQINNNQKKIVSDICVIISIYLFFIGILSLSNNQIFTITFGHVSRFATCTTITALLFLYCSNYSTVDKLTFICILSIGLFSGRSKFFGFYVLSIFCIFFITSIERIRPNLKNTSIAFIILILVLYVTKDKILFYFDIYELSAENKDFMARAGLYFRSLDIFKDYFPFGSGFGTFGTYASAVNYSPIYYKYDLNLIYGLSKDTPSFIADTYYPVLAQFGVVGATLFFIFWIKISMIAKKNFYQKPQMLKEFVLIVLIILFFAIECTSDSTITHNRGFFLMMFLGYLVSQIKHENINCK